HDTGLFDGGADPGAPIACPPESRVEYFTLSGTGSSDAAIADLKCQEGGGICLPGEPCERDGCTAGSICPSKGTCAQTLRDWEATRRADLRLEPIYRCEDDASVYCDDDRFDLRSDKVFYAEGADQAVFRALDDEIFEAFRY